jgi:hypothetical protein
LGYFEAHDYADVFERISRDHDVDWKERFREDRLYVEFVQRPLLGAAAQSQQRTAAPPLPPQPKWDWIFQFRVLTRRYLQIIANDRRNLAILLLPAPLLALLILAISTPHSLDPRDGLLHPHAGEVILMLVIGITGIGQANAIREIVKEFPIYRRERSTGLSISAYVASKYVVIAGLIALQSLVLALITLHRQDGPRDALVLGWPFGEVLVATFLTGLAAGSLALLVSAAVNQSDKAITLIPLLLVPQLVLSGYIFPLDNGSVMRDLSVVVSANWGMAAIGATADLNTLDRGAALPDSGPLKLPSDSRWAHDRATWFKDICGLLGLTGLFALGTLYALRRRDPAVMSARPLREEVMSLFHRPGVRVGSGRIAGEAMTRLLQAAAWAALIFLLHRFI